MKVLLFLLFVPLAASQAQTVKNTSYTSATGEKVLRIETTLPVDRKTAWELFTKDEQLKKWVAPQVHIELATGGYMLTNYNKDKPLSDPSSIRLGIRNYLDQEMITYKVELNDNFSKTVQSEDQNLQEVVQLVDAGKGQTRIISSMIGWGKTAEWDKIYAFFV